MNFAPRQNLADPLLTNQTRSKVLSSGLRVATTLLVVLFVSSQTLIDSQARMGAPGSTAFSFATQDTFGGCPCSRGTQSRPSKD